MGVVMAGVAPPVRTRPSGEDLRVGEVIDGRYRIMGQLGKGGMGVVYRGAHVKLKRDVAIKVVSAAYAANPEIRGRFEREAVAIGKIDHPNCVGVYDVGQLPDGSLYLAMELLNGHTLGQLLERELQLPPARVLHILRHVLRGLEHVHASGLVHRDIKPENIFLVREGDDFDFAKILDFGIAKPMNASPSDEGVKLTQAGMAFGTPIYMAPEQALGNPLDGRADLYAVAVMGYELLTGAPPFYSDDKLEVMSMHTARPVPPMKERLVAGAVEVPVRIEQTMLRGLTKKPSDRYASASDFLAAIDAAERMITESIFADLDTDAGAGSAPLTSTGSQPLQVWPAPPAAARPASPPITGAAAVTYATELQAPEFNHPATNANPSTGEPSLIIELDRPAGTTRNQASRKTWWFVAAGLLVLTIAGIVAWQLTRQPAPLPDSARRAAAALEHGDAQKAIRLIEATPNFKDDATLQMLLGHANAAKRLSAAALTAYERVFALAPAREADPVLRANLLAMADDKDVAIASRAFDLMLTKTKIADAHQRVKNAAVDDNLERRRLARAVAEKHGLLDELDHLTMYSLDLDGESTCELRKAAVARLRALGDPHAIPALERALVRKGKSGPWRGKPVNGCLIDDANAAIAYLTNLTPGPHAAHPPAPPAK